MLPDHDRSTLFVVRSKCRMMRIGSQGRCPIIPFPPLFCFVLSPRLDFLSVPSRSSRICQSWGWLENSVEVAVRGNQVARLVTIVGDLKVDMAEWCILPCPEFLSLLCLLVGFLAERWLDGAPRPVSCLPHPPKGCMPLYRSRNSKTSTVSPLSL